jgi:hypothetical protein
VRELKLRAREHERQFTTTWTVNVDEAWRRLEALGSVGLAVFASYLTGSIPPEFFDEGPASRRDVPDES